MKYHQKLPDISTVHYTKALVVGFTYIREYALSLFFKKGPPSSLKVLEMTPEPSSGPEMYDSSPEMLSSIQNSHTKHVALTVSKTFVEMPKKAQRQFLQLLDSHTKEYDQSLMIILPSDCALEVQNDVYAKLDMRVEVGYENSGTFKVELVSKELSGSRVFRVPHTWI